MANLILCSSYIQYIILKLKHVWKWLWNWCACTVAELARNVYNFIQAVKVHSSIISNITTCKLIYEYFNAYSSVCKLQRVTFLIFCISAHALIIPWKTHTHTHSRTLTHTSISLSINVLYSCVPSLPSYSLPLPRAFAFRECPAYNEDSLWSTPGIQSAILFCRQICQCR